MYIFQKQRKTNSDTPDLFEEETRKKKENPYRDFLSKTAKKQSEGRKNGMEFEERSVCLPTQKNGTVQEL